MEVPPTATSTSTLDLEEKETMTMMDPESVLRELFDQIVFECRLEEEEEEESEEDVKSSSSSSSYGSMRGGLGVRFVKGSAPDVLVVEFSDVFTAWIRKLCQSTTRDRIDALICNILTDKISSFHTHTQIETTSQPDPTLPAALSWLKDHVALDPGGPQHFLPQLNLLLLLRVRSALFHTIDHSTAHQYPYRKRKKIHHYSNGSPNASIGSFRIGNVPTRRSQRTSCLLKYGESHLPRKRIPVGPEFQADVPDWTEPPKSSVVTADHKNSEDMRWLGVRLWPVKDKKIKTKLEPIGKGRDEQCSCPSPRSIDCIRYHVKMSRLALANELGLAFFSMGFDDMGEEVANSWTSDEQMAFETLMREKPISAEVASLYPPLRGIPSKSRQNLVSYYLNVYNLRKMSMKTRSMCEEVDSDDDDNDGQT